MTQTTIKRLSSSTNLIDVLIQIENFLDSLDLYVFKNWIEGEIYRGPNVQRYWVDLTLRYAYEEMPDPQGGMRLLKHGAKVTYEKCSEEVTVVPNPKRQGNKMQAQPPETEEQQYWLVDVRIPRRYIEELYDDDIELYDDDIEQSEVEAASDARDENIDADDAILQGDDQTDSDQEEGDDNDEEQQ